MKKSLIAALFIVVGISGMLYATETRVLTMGNANMIVRDVANISLFPQTINDYPNLFIAENDDDDYFRSVGAHFKLGNESKPMVIGAYFSSDNYNNWLFYDIGHGDYIYNANNRIALIYGRELAGNPFGFAFRYFNASRKETYDKDTAQNIYDYLDNFEYSLTRFEFSAGITLMEKKLELAAGLAMTSWKDQEYYFNPDTIYGDYTKPKGNLDLTFNARYWMNPMGKYVLIPHFSFMSSKQGLDYHPGRVDTAYYDDGETVNDTVVYGDNEVYEDKYTSFDLGIGMNYQAADKILVVGDIGMMLEASKEKSEYQFADFVQIGGVDRLVLADTTFEDKWNWKALPYFRLGIDAEVFKWLDLRAGAETYWVGSKYQPSRDSYSYEEYRLIESKYGYVSTDTYLGAGFHWNNLGIDAEMDPQFLTNGPYFISGNNDEGDSDFAWRVSLVYHF